MTVSLLSSPDSPVDLPVSDPDVEPPPLSLLSAGLRHVWGPEIWAAVSIYEPRQLVK